MTPTHIREKIMEGLKERLELIITDTSIEWSSYRKPKIIPLSRSALNIEQFPFIMTAIQGETKVDRSVSGTTRIQDATLTVLLDCWIESDDISEELSRILFDVEKVIALNPQIPLYDPDTEEFVATCRDSRVTGNQTIISEEMSGRATVQILVEIRYGHLDTDPSQLR